MFEKNKYTRWYYNIINHRLANPLPNTVYQEKHHIIPKSLGGSNKKENLVSVSAREHFVCHRLLVKMVKGSHKAKMSFAIRQIINVENQHQNRHLVSSKTYKHIMADTKSAVSNSFSGINNPYYGKLHSEVVKIKMREKRKLQPPPMLGIHHNEKTKEKLREANKVQFSNPEQVSLRKEKSKKQFENAENRFKAGNGKRGKSWYYDPESGHSILCFLDEKPNNYIKGRKINKW